MRNSAALSHRIPGKNIRRMSRSARLQEAIEKTLPGASIRINRWPSKAPRNARFL